MARPTKWRKIESAPTVSFFIPSEKEGEEIPENTLKVEELEAIRLKDLEGLEQEDCAERMEISRPTFQRILLAAREKIADSLVHGKIIHIEGGRFTRNICPIVCTECGKEWMDRFENMKSTGDDDYVCPDCGSSKIVCKHSCGENLRDEHCRRYGSNYDD